MHAISDNKSQIVSEFAIIESWVLSSIETSQQEKLSWLLLEKSFEKSLALLFEKSLVLLFEKSLTSVSYTHRQNLKTDTYQEAK